MPAANNAKKHFSKVIKLNITYFHFETAKHNPTICSWKAPGGLRSFQRITKETAWVFNPNKSIQHKDKVMVTKASLFEPLTKYPFT